MSEAERIEIPDETAEAAAPQEPETASAPEAQPEPGTEAAAEVEISSPPGEGAPSGEEAAEGGAEHGLSGATLESMSRTDPQSVAAAEAEKTKWERRREEIQQRLSQWYKLYMADGGFKLGISLVTAIVAAMIIVLAGIFSERQLGVVFWRAVIGFFVSGLFMGGILYWLDRFGIPLFISKNEEQIQMEWLSEAEEPDEGTDEAAITEPEEAEPGEMEELMPQEGGAVQLGEGTADHPEGEPAGEPQAETGEQADNGAASSETDGQAGEAPGEEPPGEDMDGLENAVLDDAFASGETGEENAEPPTFAPMTADTLETLRVPEN